MKKISTTEKNRVNKIISRIEQSKFTESDIYQLLITLRAFSNNDNLFREIADFVAHKDRDKGLIHDSLNNVFLGFQYGILLKGKRLNILELEPFSSLIIELLNNQTNNYADKSFSQTYKIEKGTFRQLLKRLFVKLSVDLVILNLLEFRRLTDNERNTFITTIKRMVEQNPPPKYYQQEDIIESIRKVLKYNDINYNKTLLLAQCEKIILCIIYLTHHSIITLKTNNTGTCKICVRKYSPIELMTGPEYDRNIDKLGEISVVIDFEIDSEWGNVSSRCEIIYTDLDANKWLDDNLINSLRFELILSKLSESNEYYSFLGEDILFTDNFKLSTKQV